MNIHKTITKLLHSQLQVSDLQEESVTDLKTVGRQFALKYRHCDDKESPEAKHILQTLIAIRTSVKAKMGVKDMLLERYFKENEGM